MKYVLIIMIAQSPVTLWSTEFDSAVTCMAAFDGIIKDFTKRYSEYLAKHGDSKLDKLPSPAFISYHCAKK